MTIEKAPYGSPCNGCGLCCYEETCVLAAGLFNQLEGPCPALQYVDGKSQCGLVANPARYAPVQAAVLGEATLTKAAMMLTGSGLGCDAQLEGEADDPAFRDKLVKFRLDNFENVEDYFAMFGLVPA